MHLGWEGMNSKSKLKNKLYRLAMPLLNPHPLFLILPFLSLATSAISGKAFAQQASTYPKLAKMQAVEARIEDLLTVYPKEDLLVIWDIDFTLILPKEPAFQVYNRIAYKDHLKAFFQDLDAHQTTMVINCMTRFASELVDPKAPQVIKNLQAQNIKMIACTASMTGALPPHKRAESMRFEALKKQGIDFSKAFPEHHDTELSTLKGFLQRSPVFYKGILFANGLKNNPCKGEAIVELLKTLAFHPKAIVFIDDKEHYLSDVEAALKAHMPQTTFLGITFTGENEHEPKPITEAEFTKVWQALKEDAMSLVQADREKLQ